MSDSELVVFCHSGHTYAERPAFFIWQGTDYYVENLEDAWVEPGQRHFMIHTANDQRFHLCYDEVQDSWALFTIK